MLITQLQFSSRKMCFFSLYYLSPTPNNTYILKLSTSTLNSVHKSYIFFQFSTYGNTNMAIEIRVYRRALLLPLFSCLEDPLTVFLYGMYGYFINKLLPGFRKILRIHFMHIFRVSLTHYVKIL